MKQHRKRSYAYARCIRPATAPSAAMTRPAVPHLRTDTTSALLFLLVPLLPWAIVLTVAGLSSSPEPRRPAVTARLFP